MDIKVGNNFRTERYKLYRRLGRIPYDYESEGILIKCLPKILFKGNSLLVSFLQLIDMRIILILKYTDRLKKFKYISQY